MAVTHVRLLDSLREPGFHTALVASYSCDLAFVESVALPRLRGAGCRNIVLLVDSRTFARALATGAGLLRRAGREYSVHPIRADGLFHPKLIVQLGEQAGRAIVTSANFSSGGFGQNLEVAVELTCRGGVEDPIEPLVASAFDHLRGLLDAELPTVAHHLRLAHEDAPWLAKAPRAERITSDVHDGAIEFLTAPARPLLREFCERVGGAAVRRLVIVSPFWDRDLSALRALLERLHPDETLLLVDPKTTNFPGDVGGELPRTVSIHRVPSSSEHASSSGRYVHAKVILAETDTADHALVGSANCTAAALGTGTTRPRNAEVVVYRRAARGEIARALGLEGEAAEQSALDPGEVAKLAWHGDDQDEGGGIWPGSLELRGDRVWWRPAVELDTGGARLELSDARGGWRLEPVALRSEAPGAFAELPGGVVPHVLLGRILLADGRRTSATIVHRLSDLRRSAPGRIGQQLQSALEQLALGEGELLQLLKPLERLVFTPQVDRAPRPADASHRAHDPSPQEHEERTLPYEEFVKGRRSPAKGTSELVSGREGNVVLILETLRAQLNARDRGHEVELVEEDTETGQGAATTRGARPASPPPRVTSSQLETGRRRLRKLVDTFRKWSQRVADGTNEAPTAENLARLWTMSLLVLALGGRKVQVEDGELAEIAPLAGPASGCSLPELARDVLGCFFAPGSRAPVSVLVMPADADVVPDDVFGAWATCCALLTLALPACDIPDSAELRHDLETVAWCLYERTGVTTERFDQAALWREIAGRLAISPAVGEVELTRAHRWHEWIAAEVRRSHALPALVGRQARPGEVRIAVGDRVRTMRAGPRYVREIDGATAHLNNPGLDAHFSVNAGYVESLAPTDYPDAIASDN